MEKNNQPQFAIHRSWILSVLLIIPAVAVFGAWDNFFNNQQLQQYLGFGSLLLPLYLLVFELPHVIASFFGFFQTKYVQHYRRHLSLGLPLFLLAFAVLIGFDFYVAFLFYLIATLYHVIRQQTGIALFFGVPKNRWHLAWSWLLIVGLLAGLGSIYNAMQPAFISYRFETPLFVLIHVTLLLATVTTIRLALQTKTKLGILYVLSTLAMALVSYWMLVLGYEFLAVLVVRVIHDVTAFIFYITHEMNANQEAVKNVLYRYLPFMPWSLVIVVPLAAILMGLAIRTGIEDPQILLGVVMTVSLAHYYLESIIWKRDNLHREQIKIA